MAEVVTLVTGLIDPDRLDEIAGLYREALKDGPPPDLEETFLLRGNTGKPQSLVSGTAARISRRCSHRGMSHSPGA
ncbi:MAG: hypothetical protein H0V49_04170 [Nocardioidaceae bacterium]|nr:hypothetical protein [Nocardioidaceae bacterium]